MRLGILALGVCFGAISASAQDRYVPPPIGTQVTWVTETAQGRTTRVSEVVATGADFAIHLYDLGWDVDNPTSYFAEFSGLHIASCALSMPDLQKRQRLQEFWPLITGEALDLGDEDKSTYVVGARQEHTVSQAGGAHPAQSVTSYVGEVRTDKTVSLELHTPVSVNLQDGTDERAIEIFYQRAVQRTDTIEKSVLGRCASLLDEVLIQ
ncbi:MAG: hypothetical protein AAF292_09670 [Pseudomonadota bacterium]